MLRPLLARCALAALIPTALPASPPRATAGEPVFTFAPADGLVLERDYRMEAVTTLGDKAISQVSLRTVRRLTYTRTGEGWRIASVPLELEFGSGLRTGENKLSELLVNQAYTLVLDAQGRIERVEGFDNLAEEAARILEGEAIPAASDFFQAEVQRERVRNQYEQRYGMLINEAAVAGEQYQRTATQQLPGGSNRTMEIVRAARVEEVKKADDGARVATVRYAETSEAGALVELLNKRMEEAAETAESKLEAFRFTERGRLQVEAGTLVPLRSEALKVVRTRLEEPIQGEHVFTRTEKVSEAYRVVEPE